MPTKMTNTEIENELVTEKTKQPKMTTSYFATPFVWSTALKLLFLHFGLIFVPFVLPFAKNATIVFDYLLLLVAVLGIQIGAHRLWTHRSFKASFGLRLVLAIAQTISLQNDIYEWCRDHRVHHKWSETDADPHNSNRGFFFSHMVNNLNKRYSFFIDFLTGMVNAEEAPGGSKERRYT